jgi:hypothetical protein
MEDFTLGSFPAELAIKYFNCLGFLFMNHYEVSLEYMTGIQTHALVSFNMVRHLCWLHSRNFFFHVQKDSPT